MNYYLIIVIFTNFFFRNFHNVCFTDNGNKLIPAQVSTCQESVKKDVGIPKCLIVTITYLFQYAGVSLIGFIKLRLCLVSQNVLQFP